MRLFAVLLLTAGLAACAEGPSSPASEDTGGAVSRLPGYRVGDRLAWSNGRSEIVTAVQGEIVSWKDQDGKVSQSYRNFLLPTLAWSSPEGPVTSTIDAQPDLLWPLRAGTSETFQVQRTVGGTVLRDEWGCHVGATERINVPLGSFDTIKAYCQQYRQGSIIGEIRWNYAPALGRVIRQTWSGAGQPDELVGIGSGTLDPRAEAVAAQVRQQGLEQVASGTRAVGQGGGIRATLLPRTTFTTKAGAYCRDFVQTLSSPGAEVASAGVACREKSGAWRVVAP